jgi:hypothetical protein
VCPILLFVSDFANPFSLIGRRSQAKSKARVESESPEPGPSRSQAQSVKSTRSSDSLREKSGRFAGLEHRSRVEIRQSLFHKANDLEIERERIAAKIEAIYNLIDKYTD